MAPAPDIQNGFGERRWRFLWQVMPRRHAPMFVPGGEMRRVIGRSARFQRVERAVHRDRRNRDGWAFRKRICLLFKGGTSLSKRFGLIDRKSLYLDVLELVESRLRPGAVIIADNADHCPEYLKHIANTVTRYLSMGFTDEVELTIRVG